MINVQKETGVRHVHIHVALDVAMHVTGMEYVTVNTPGRGRNVMNVKMDAGEVNVKRHVVLDVVMYVATMDDVLVNLGGQERDAKAVCT